MATQHARRSTDGDVDERREERAEEPAPQELALQLQQAHGNQAVARVLARQRTLARIGGDPTFTFGGQQVDQDTITAGNCEDSVEEIIEDRYGGLRNLFMRNEVATSVGQWADLIFSFFEENYILDEVDRGTVLNAIKAVKDKHREETLLHMARVHVYWALGEEVAPWDVDELKKRLRKAGVYLEAEDDGVLDAIMETGGEFARTKVEFDTAANIELTRRGQRGGADRPPSAEASAGQDPGVPGLHGRARVEVRLRQGPGVAPRQHGRDRQGHRAGLG